MAAKMRDWAVPVAYEVSGEINVQARTKRQALKLAREKYYNGRAVGSSPVEIMASCTVDVDFAHGDDINTIEEILDE